MNKFIAIVIGATMLNNAPAVVLPFTDHFSYSEGNLFTVASGIWDAGGNTGPELMVSNSAALTAPPGFSASSGNGIRWSPSGTARRNMVQFTSINSGELYASFLIDVQSVSASKLCAYFEATSSSTTTPELGVFLNSGTIGVGKDATSAGATTPLGAGTHLVVVRYTFSANGVADLWLDPSSADYGAGSAPTPTLTTSGSGNLSLQYFAINSPSGSGPLAFIDEVRVGPTWADVTGSPTPLVGEKLTFTAQPGDAVAGATMSAVVVQVQTGSGVSVPSNNVPITLTLSGSGTLSGTTTLNTDSSGKAVFTDLSIDTPGTGKQLTASASGIGTGLTNAVSGSFTITAPPTGVKLGFTTQPANALTGDTMNPVVVQVQEASGAAVASNNVPITLTLTSGSGTLGGTTTQNTDSSGKATFNNLTIDAAGTGKQLTAAASGIGTGLTNAVSGTFSITAPPVGPTITQAVKTVSNIILRGTNGTPSGNYAVLSATNLAILTSQWISLATNTFDIDGNFDCTNSVSAGDPLNFYRLLAGVSLPGLDQGSNGYATVGTGVTGGGDTTNIVTVTNLAGFIAAASNNPTPAIILLKSNLTLSPNGDFYLGPNKTIIGVGTNVTITGDLAIYGTQEVLSPATNIIIRNIIFTNPNGVGEGDGVTIKYGGHHVWVDHCTFVDCSDGTVDVTREGDFVTVSWCKFYYTQRNNHEDVNLMGGNDDDTTDNGKLHVTFHHNWWSKICRERMPSVRFGRVHVYNNYYDTTATGVLTNNYCVRTRLYSEVLVENNYFENVHNPWELATSDAGPNGKLFASGNITNNCLFTTDYNASLPNNGVVILIPGTDTLTPSGTDPIGLNPPPYPYTLDLATDIPNIVTNNAGAGKGPFAP